MYLKLINYIVNEASFKANPLPQGVTNFTVKPNIRMDIKMEPTNFSLAITVVIAGTEAEPVPFDLTAKLTGNFQMTDKGGNIEDLRIESANTLYPYMRSFVSTLTANANIVPYHLPIIDFSSAPATPESANGAKPKEQGGKRGVDAITIKPIDEEV